MARRALLIASGSLLIVFGFTGLAQAQTGSSNVTNTNTNNNDNNNANENSQSQDQSQEQTVNLLGLFGDDDNGHGHHNSHGKAGGRSLPKTGTDAAAVGGVATGTMIVGASLMEMARRRRHRWFSPATAAEALATTHAAPQVDVAVEPTVHSEADLLLPLVETGQTTPREPDDFITPSF